MINNDRGRAAHVAEIGDCSWRLLPVTGMVVQVVSEARAFQSHAGAKEKPLDHG
jgi:hypothetical protein